MKRQYLFQGLDECQLGGGDSLRNDSEAVPTDRLETRGIFTCLEIVRPERSGRQLFQCQPCNLFRCIALTFVQHIEFSRVGETRFSATIKFSDRLQNVLALEFAKQVGSSRISALHSVLLFNARFRQVWDLEVTNMSRDQYSAS